MKKSKRETDAVLLVFKSMIYTASAIALVIIGYYAAQYFFS